MVLVIHQDDDMDFSAPKQQRKVSFQTSAPLTPYNKQRPRHSASKQPNTPKPVTKTEAITMTSYDKENAASSTMTNLRRSIRSSMSPSPTPLTMKKPSAAAAAALKTPLQKLSVNANAFTSSPLLRSADHQQQQQQRTPLSSALRRSMLGSGRKLGPPQRVRTTPTSMLHNEMIFDDPDMSLLISPSAMGNPNDVVPSPDRNHTNAASSRVAFKMMMSVDDSILEEEASSPSLSLSVTKLRVEAQTQETAEMTVRGNGVQMDLSEMFSGLDSPVKKSNTASSEESMPSVNTNNLRQGVLLDFGDDNFNVVGQARSLPFAIEAAPDAIRDFFLEIEKIPFMKGVNLVVSDPNSALLKGLTPSIKSHQKNKRNLGGPTVPNMLNVQPGEKAMLWVTWTPVQAGGVREVILLKLPRGPGRLRVTILGKAREATKSKKIRFSMTPARATSKSKIFSTAKDNFTPAKESTTGIYSSSLSPSAPIASAMKVKASISIPEDWAEKQCNAFTEWLNYMFQPTEDLDHEIILKQIENGHTGSHQIMNRAAFRTLVVHQRLAQARTRALQVFHTIEMSKARKVIVAEIARGRLSLRNDRDMHADLNLRGKVVSLLLSYSTPWLRIGLEVLFGEPICVETPATNSIPTTAVKDNRKSKNKPQLSRMKLTLKNIIIARLLADPETLRKYTKGRCNVPSGRFEKQYREEIRILILTRLLVLVTFLDKAKIASVLDRVPRLFTKDSKVKSTRDVLVSLCRDFLSSEGDIIKHLSRIGLKVAYKQEPIDELDFTVTNLAADIRDGVRLARMEEILTNAPPKSLLAALRLPAVSRLQKLHNVGAVLGTLGDRGVPDIAEVAAHHIVDGYREQVLKLLWTVVANCGISAVLNPSAVEEEINKVQHANRIRSVKWDLRCMMSLQSGELALLEENGSDEQKIRNLLLRWCNAVISPFGVQVSDYTASFADGIAICLLIHYYHPRLIRLDEIEPTGRHGLDMDGALVNERLNLTLASERMSELGGIPKLLPMGDSSNPPEEKSMLLCLVYLCSRLMESSTEVLACQAIQHWYRRKKRIEMTSKKFEASKVIWQAWRERKVVYYHAQELKYGDSVRVIEAFVFAHKDRLHALRKARKLGDARIRCITGIQALVRRRQAQQKVRPLLRRNSSAQIIQKNWRISQMHKALKSQHVRRESAISIQAAWRGYAAYLNLSTVLWGVTTLQAFVRGLAVRKRQVETTVAAVQIQRIWRGFMCQVLLQVDLLDVVTVQSVGRRYLAIKLRARRIASVIKVQQFSRRVLAMSLLNKKKNDLHIEKQHHQSASLIQSSLRGYVVRRDLRNTTDSCILFQAAARGFLLRLKAKTTSSSTLLVQTNWRRYAQRKRYVHCRSAIVAIQTFVRQFLMHSRIQLEEASAVSIQAVWRQCAKRTEYQETITSAISIQCLFRLTLAARVCASRKQAVVVVQTYLRRRKASQVVEVARMKHRALVQAERERDSAIHIQSVARRMISTARVNQIREMKLKIEATLWWSAVAIQAFTRLCLATSLGRTVRRDRIARREKASALLIQRYARRYISVQEARKRRHVQCRAATSIQSQWRASVASKWFIASAKATIMMQRAFRGARVRAEIGQLSYNARIIQVAWRTFQLKMTASVEAVILLQRVLRGAKVRTEIKRLRYNAGIIQATLRMLQLRMKYKYSIRCIVLIQSNIRRRIAKSTANIKSASVLTVQAFGRMVLAKMYARTLICEKVNLMISTSAAIGIQAALRGHQSRKLLNSKRAAATIIQREWKCFIAFLQYQSDYIDIIIVQSVIRCRQAQSLATTRLGALKTVQAASRQWLALRRARNILEQKIVQLQQQNDAAIRIQSTFRGCMAKSLLRQHKAACRIQKTWRCFFVHVDFMLALLDIMTIQRCAKKYIQQRRIERAIPGITTIQSLFRGHMDRNVARYQLNAIITIQSCYRRFLVVGVLCVERQAAALIQRNVRGFLDRVDLEIQAFAAVEIQRVWRGFLDRVEAMYHIVMVLRIQSAARRYLSMRLMLHRRREVEIENSFYFYTTRLIQRSFREYQVQLRFEKTACMMQKVVRGYLARKRFAKYGASVVQIQASIRAYRVRRTRTKKATAIVVRIAAARHRAIQNPGMVLGVRTQFALKELQTSQRLTEIMEAAKILETSTRLSRNCCVAFVRVGAPNILYELIGSCNRSLPHIEILQYVLLTLQNVSSQEDLLQDVATTKSAEIFLDLVQMFRDKQEVFSVALPLLSRVARNNHALKRLCSKPESMKRLNHVLKKVSITGQSRQDISRVSRGRTSFVQHKESVKILRSLLKFLKE